MSVTKATDLFTSGDLEGAITALTEAVRKNPTDQETRGLLAEFLCIAGDLERADKQLDALGNQDAGSAPGLALFRQVVRAELARRECHQKGRVPEFIGAPTPLLEKHLEASVYIRDGEMRKAADLLAEAEADRPQPKGVCNGTPFDDFRDLDDRTACFLEVLTTTGSYYWIPLQAVVSLECSPPRRPRDLIWRRTQLSVRDGPDGEVFLPAVYANQSDAITDQTRLGRMTDWSGGDGAPVLGVGQRTFLAGDVAIPIMELETVIFDADG